MRKFLPEPCPKCGETVRGVTYVPIETVFGSSQRGRMKRTCVSCGYSWSEKSLDERVNAAPRSSE